MNARSRKVGYIVGLGALVAISILRLVNSARNDDLGSATIWIGLLASALIVAVVLAITTRRARKVAAHAAKMRPGVPIIPAYSTGETADQARASGVSARGLAAMGGSPMALSVLDDRIEVWVRKEDTPRWSVGRVPGGAAVTQAVYGARHTKAVTISDGVNHVSVMPAYRPLRATTGRVGDDVARAVTELAPT